MPARSGQYYRSEQEIAKLLTLSGLPMAFTNPFTRDYAAVKEDLAGGAQDLAEITAAVESLDSRVLITESNIASLNSEVSALNASVLSLTLQAADFDDRLLIAEAEIVDLDGRLSPIEIAFPVLQTDFNTHIADQAAHGANGEIVGRNDFCTPVIGGTVRQAAAIPAATPSTLAVTSTPNAAGVAYVQADAATWVATIDELKTDFNALITEYNALLTKVNGIISTQVSSNQRAP